MGPLAIAAAPAVIGGIAGFLGGERANKANARQAREQMAFQERMANTSWQRGVADMKAAGLNPALAYEKGGAESPGGAMAQMEDSIGRGMSSAKETAALKSRLESERVQRVATAAQADASAAQSELSRQQAKTIDTQRKLLLQQLQEDIYLKQSNAREANIRGTDLFNRSPIMTRLLYDELKHNRPLERELKRAQRDHISTSARAVEQNMRIQELMTPDEWSAYIQRSILPIADRLPVVGRRR